MKKKERYRGRLSQTGIYLAKFFRVFIFQNDWKVLPMAAVITAVVVFVVGGNLFVTQEGTINGTYSLVCICIWIGFFNSIQSVCRERDIIKREHRAGLHISAYILAQMIFQMVLCAAQTLVILAICNAARVKIPAEGVVTPRGIIDIGITVFLITYAADMLALMVSSLVRSTTTAMTVMPFLLIFQLVFSGAFFDLQGAAMTLTILAISKWGMIGLCSVGQYNSQPMVTLWNTLFKFRDVEYMGEKPLLDLIKKTEQEGKVQDFLLWSAEYNQNELYESSALNVGFTWAVLIVLALLFAFIAIVSLEFIDRDKR